MKATFNAGGLYSTYRIMSEALGYPDACAKEIGSVEEDLIRIEANKTSAGKMKCDVLGVYAHSDFEEVDTKHWTDKHVVVLENPRGHIFLVSGDNVTVVDK